MSHSIIRLLFAFALGAILSVSTPLPQYKRWIDYAALADRVALVPAWTQDGVATPSEWAAAIALANDLQSLDEHEVCSVFLIYMSRFTQATPHELQPASSKPQVLLRLMFDIPADALYPHIGTTAKDTAFFSDINPIMDAHAARQIARPVVFRNGIPFIEGAPASVSSVGGGKLPSYQPHRDFVFLKHSFPSREGLRELGKKLLANE